MKIIILKLRNQITWHLCLLPFFISANCLGQATDASFSGRITDEIGGSLPGATILMHNESTGFESATVSNIEGEFINKQLPVGIYSITISYIGLYRIS